MNNAAKWSLVGSPSSRMRSSCTEMSTMWPRSERLTMPLQTKNRQKRNVAHKGCEKMSSVCRTWSHACMSSTPSRSTQPHPPSAPYNQPFLHPMFLLWTSTQLMPLERRSWLASCKKEFSVRKPPSEQMIDICQKATHREDLKAEMEQSALKAVISMVEVSQLVNLPELL